VLVIEDFAYGIDPLEAGGRSLRDFGMTFGNPDFCALRRFLWRAWARVTATSDLIPTLEGRH